MHVMTLSGQGLNSVHGTWTYLKLWILCDILTYQGQRNVCGTLICQDEGL